MHNSAINSSPEPVAESVSGVPKNMLMSNLAVRESYRDEYWRNHDPIVEDRLLWRAQTFRHTVHLLPGQSILELGCGELRLTRALLRVSRGENKITAVTFQSSSPDLRGMEGPVEIVKASELPRPLAGRRFDCIVAMDLLDRSNSSALLQIVHELLTPGARWSFTRAIPGIQCISFAAWLCDWLANEIREA